jgi:hypothetical protein
VFAQIKSWPAAASVGLRNELRSPDNKPDLKSKSYNWADWYTHMKSCADGVHEANPNLIIFLSGLGFDTDLAPIVTGKALGNGRSFRRADFPGNKTALELHNYSKSTDCAAIKGGMERQGWNAMNSSDPAVVNVMPVVMTEFGFHQGNNDYRSVYATCLKDYFMTHKAGWMYWVLAGSYYLRSGKQDFDETWGLFNHDWSGWRSAPVVRDYFQPMIKGTLAS